MFLLTLFVGSLLKEISIVIHFMYRSKRVVIIPMSSTGMDNVIIINSIAFRNLNKNKWPGVITIWHKFISSYNKFVVFRVPHQGQICYTVNDAVDWFKPPTARRF